MSIYKAEPPREVIVHDLKTHPAPFAALWDGNKPFEIRKDDRGYESGDVVRLREWDPATETYSGRYVVAYIGYLVPCGAWGLPSTLCVFALRDAWRATELAPASSRGDGGKEE